MLNPLIFAMLLPVSPQVGVGVDVGVGVQVAVPTVEFAAEPPLVVVSPGVMVVPDYDQEIYFVGGYYWTRHGNAWFRTRSYRGGWAAVPVRYVPRGIYRVPPGHYRRFHGGRPYVRGPVRHAPARFYGRRGFGPRGAAGRWHPAGKGHRKHW